jgi:hypothetical protein
LDIVGFDCRHVSDRELAQIESGKNCDENSERHEVPYAIILKDVHIWGIWLASLGGSLGFNLFVQFGPIYLNKVRVSKVSGKLKMVEVLNYDIENTGFASALPFIASMVVKICAGPLSDHSTFIR